MTCSKCGALLNGAAFCASCGTPANGNPVNTPSVSPSSFEATALPFGIPVVKTNGMAIASLVTSIAGSFCGIGILGFIFGLIALNQIKKSNGTQTGQGMAIAGTIIGGLWVLAVLFIIIMMASLGGTTAGGYY